jgi:hypothetical protein
MDRDKGGLSATTELGISNRLCVVHFLDNVSKLYSVFFFILSLTFIYFVFILSWPPLKQPAADALSRAASADTEAAFYFHYASFAKG